MSCGRLHPSWDPGAPASGAHFSRVSGSGSNRIFLSSLTSTNAHLLCADAVQGRGK